MKKLLTFAVFSFVVLLSLPNISSAQGWVQQTSGTVKNLRDVFFSNFNIGIAVGNDGTILKTTNGGTNWIALTSGVYNNLKGIHSIDANRSTVVGTNGTILQTSNGGTEWIQRTSETTKDLNAVFFVDSDTGIAVGQDGIILRTTDGGLSWLQQLAECNMDLNAVVFSNTHIGAAVGNDGRILKTTNGGVNWINQNSGTTSDLYSVDFADASVGNIVGYNGIILGTTDGGVNWTNQVSGISKRLNGVFLNDVNTGTAVGGRGNILRTSDGGVNWIQQTSGTSNNIYEVFFSNAFIGTSVGNAGTILRTTTGGGNVPSFSASPQSLIFGNVVVNSSKQDSVTVTNTGTSTLTISTVTSDNAEFSVTPSGGSILPLSSQKFYITFSPTDSGPEMGNVIFTNDASSSPDTVTCTGTGVPSTFQLSVSILAGWNMVSIPGLHPVDQDINTWWSGRDPTTNVYKHDVVYEVVTNVETGNGYWMKQLSSNIYNTGDEWPASGIILVPHDPISVSEGWNIIGGYEDTVSTMSLTTIPPGLIAGLIFGHSEIYEIATVLYPGHGYWIKLAGAGQVIVPDVLTKINGEVVEWFKKDRGKITITDNSGQSFILYAVKGEVDLTRYELPPVPPAGMLDIRYSSGRIAEDINSSIKTIEMRSLEYPITLKVEGMDIRLQDESGKDINKNIKSGDRMTISNSQINKLMVTGELMPDVYALEQNYPNPFNPTTVIKYYIPELNFVTLKVYDVLGNEIETLVSEKKSIGSYEVEFSAIGGSVSGRNASTLTSGVYLYRIQAGNYIETKKMILLK